MEPSHRSSTFNLSAENDLSMYHIRNERTERSYLRGRKGLFSPDTPMSPIIIECSYLIPKRLWYQQTPSSPLLRYKGLRQ